MARIIAFYLPQYHPVPENDLWWGPGFTEWTNVAKARPLYPGHRQPHIPADLGFYDLRLPEVRERQAELAREAGIEGFCYWHYWFGQGKRLLEKPFEEVVRSGKPDFPFCLAWANHSWYKKRWNPDSAGKDELLVEQQYPGTEDYEAHFRTMLPAFCDKRYMRVNGKPIFFIFDPSDERIADFMRCWRRLAAENGLGDFYFVLRDADSRNKAKNLAMGADAIYNDDVFNIHHHLSKPGKVWRWAARKWLHIPTIFQYRKAIRYMVTPDAVERDVIPVIAPNWDHSPRSKGRAIILHDARPAYFKQVALTALNAVRNKPAQEQIIVLKSWNEWGEGNYMEPDLQYGHGNIEALSKAMRETQTLETGNL